MYLLNQNGKKDLPISFEEKGVDNTPGCYGRKIKGKSVILKFCF